ncbi:HvfC/BufC N-terminal domain-containing protein [Undibacterium crateris]|uniref:HvfC/BufC N-terminal domain-containing protein n=1 Tax=Undibacterium crateris TaxID=2528175 RepID=UPI001389A4FB|nr:DNA-binding domain-containing protein [Undibacterium crateris]NDI85938.1 hypothetical protein [Undibacterium crateris]
MKPELFELQQSFARALQNVQQVPDLLPQLQPHTELQDRLAIYRGNYAALTLRALESAYPVLRCLVGEDFFAQMAKAFALAHPSDSGDMHRFGAALARFLGEAELDPKYAYFVDVARLEWQVHRAYFATNAAALSLTDLIRKAGEMEQELTAVRPVLHPACQLFRSESGAIDVWLAHQETSEKADPDQHELLLPVNLERNLGVLSRVNWKIQVHRIEEPAWLALEQIQSGVSLEQAFEVALQAQADFDVAQGLRQWLDWGCFADVLTQ